MTSDWKLLALDLSTLLHLQTPPLSVVFTDERIDGVSMFNSPMPPAADDGRTGRVPAGCVFWTEAIKATFTTVGEDHANCSVGSMTHGFKTLEEVAGNSDVAALLESGWVTLEVVPQIPVVRQRAKYVTYGPLEDTSADPDVVFLRINAKQAMVMSDAIPGLRFEGKPQCHIIPMAKEDNLVAISVGCMLSRVRTGIPNTEMTCAIPARRLEEVVGLLKTTVAADNAVAVYASKDAARFVR